MALQPEIACRTALDAVNEMCEEMARSGEAERVIEEWVNSTERLIDQQLPAAARQPRKDGVIVVSTDGLVPDTVAQELTRRYCAAGWSRAEYRVREVWRWGFRSRMDKYRKERTRWFGKRRVCYLYTFELTR